MTIDALAVKICASLSSSSSSFNSLRYTAHQKNYESTTAVHGDHMLRGIRIPKNCYEITRCLRSAFFGGKNNINCFPLAIDTVSHK